MLVLNHSHSRKPHWLSPALSLLIKGNNERNKKLNRQNFDSPAFEKYPIIERIARFIDFVDKVLNLRDDVADVNKFYLTLPLSQVDDESRECPKYYDILASHLNAWICSVVRHNIKTLSITFRIIAEWTFELP
ncbi:hypothetical protein MKW98_029669 [Papaver atlanticum]|uniref:Uncharacterized protein n=1 Tax=Papaver atlanticum TaxID=357466 RepID=A0AAD4XS91_9MAGN|nr:hypothetical protein MKW98_029669 [Papaver atlanticum]